MLRHAFAWNAVALVDQACTCKHAVAVASQPGRVETSNGPTMGFIWQPPKTGYYSWALLFRD